MDARILPPPHSSVRRISRKNLPIENLACLIFAYFRQNPKAKAHKHERFRGTAIAFVQSATTSQVSGEGARHEPYGNRS
jgi:hypothetical protein